MIKYAFHGLSILCVCPGESNDASFIPISQQPREIQNTCPFMRCADEKISVEYYYTMVRLLLQNKGQEVQQTVCKGAHIYYGEKRAASE